MLGTFYGAEVGLRALRAAQAAMDTASHNIANVNTPGYARQRAQLTATAPYAVAGASHLKGAFQVGSGVMAVAITQARNSGLDRQVRLAISDREELVAKHDALAQIEDALGENGTDGINTALTKFFNAFQDLSGKADNKPLRDAAVASATALATTFHQVRTRMDGIEESLNAKTEYSLAEINATAERIADLNQEIRRVTAQGDQPNDLIDQREALLESLSGTVKTTVVQMSDGTVAVQIGGYSLVQGENARPAASLADLTANGNDVGGSLQGDIDGLARLQAYRTKLDGLATTVISEVNALHQGGVDRNGVAGLDLFTGTDARTIAVDPAIAANSNLLAASATPVPPATFAVGNGENALAIAQLANKALTSGPLSNETLRQYWSGTTASLGVEVNALDGNITSQDAYARQVEARREAVSGVSLDDEMADMVRFQRAYQAAARLISVQDENVQTLLQAFGG